MNPRLLEIYIKIKDRALFVKRDQMKTVFSNIYASGGWSAETPSGIGSTIQATSIIRGELPSLLKRLDVHSMLDAPCGDFNWMKELDLTGIHYTGIDIVKNLIAHNQELFASEAREFRVMDIVKDCLPKVDFIMCRDCLIHLSLRNAMHAIKNFKASGSRYLFSTTYTDVAKNPEILTGQWRPINLQAPPFNFPTPIELIVELPEEGRAMGLWELSSLP
jgi:2-polyprenyl-3-methyl-5-hydroxy-6-metoxy-1,4-benzoquinol methylase